ncbi:hypothetical protein PX554_19980 [Sphingomonas sp. H39-1-10]|uniref:hypothetical protein n=1 Tax=Sphingomonas pollutisoli TaxID=3030829 RepID=UPI0023B99DB9|nr:hypothetical protein [Sphingomonas pollutisoli]MDF0490412.1 hypothetical protein [Sphingomonas pollutisoli]
MARRNRAAIPPEPRKSLLEWIESDDGDSTGSTPPACSRQAQSLHARILADPAHDRGETPEPLAPPSGLRLAPLG